MSIYSIIIPHRNCPDLLQKCVDSIPLREDVQIIIVDDNSDEGKKPYINRPNVEVFFLDVEQSNGAGRARNVGLQNAKGKWILFSDSDDTFETENLNRMLDKYADSEADIVFFNANKIDETSREVLGQHISKKKYDRNADQYIGFLKYWSNVPWAKFIKRSIIEQNSITFSEVPSANDLYFSTVSGYYAKKVLVDFTIIYNYSVRLTGNITSKVTEQSVISRLSEASKRNSFLVAKGDRMWITNLYTAFYEKLLVVGYSPKEAVNVINHYLTSGPKKKWHLAFILKKPFFFFKKIARCIIK